MMFRIAFLSASLGLLLACGGNEADKAKVADGSAEVDVEAIAKIARAIKEEPAKAEAALQAGGMARADFEAALYTIAGDPKLSVKYVRLLQATQP